MSSLLPTLQHASWAVTEFHDAFVNALHSDRRASELRLYFYAVTQSDWRIKTRGDWSSSKTSIKQEQP